MAGEEIVRAHRPDPKRAGARCRVDCSCGWRGPSVAMFGEGQAPWSAHFEAAVIAARRDRTPVTRVMVCEDWRSSMEVLELWGHGAPVLVEWANKDAGTLDSMRGRLQEPHGYDSAVHLYGVDGGGRRVSFPVGIVRTVELHDHQEVAS